MTKSLSLFSSLKAFATAPIKYYSQNPTQKQSLFKPGGSQLIKDNLMRVLEHKDHRFYAAYLTGVTGVRSALETPVTMGKLLLNTATWLVDLTSSRSEGYAIVTEGFFDVIHSIKTTIALPIFSIAGLIFPSDVFGLFENIPGVQTEILNEKSTLAQIKADKSRTEAELLKAQEDLLELRAGLSETNKELERTLALREIMQESMAKAKEAEIDVERLKTEILEHKNTIAQLQEDELIAAAKLRGLSKENTRQGNQKELVGIQTNLLKAQKELLALQHEINEIEDELFLAKEDLAVANKGIANCENDAATAENLRAEVRTLENTLAELKGKESANTLKLDTIRDEIARQGILKKENESLHTELLAGLKRDRSLKQEELEKVQATLKETIEKHSAAQSKLENLNADIDKQTSKAEALSTEVKKLESTKQELTKNGTALRTQIESQKCDLESLNQRIDEAKKTMYQDLNDLKQQINEKTSTLSDHHEHLSRLGRKNTALEKKRTELSEQIRKLEFTTLPGLITRRDDLLIEVDQLDLEKEALAKEMAANKELLRTETDSAKQLAGRIQELKTTLAELEAKEAHLTNNVLPALEKKETATEARRTNVLREISVERKKLLEAQTLNAETQSQLEIIVRSLESMRLEEASFKETLESIQKAILEASKAKTGVEENTEKTISSLNEKLLSLGTSISENTKKDAALKLSLDEQERTFKTKTLDFERVAAESAEVEKKLLSLNVQAEDLTSKVKALKETIQTSESKKAALEEQQSELQIKVQSLTTSVEKLSTQSRELEEQVRTATEKKDAALQDYNNLIQDINSAKSFQSKIQDDIAELKLNIESLEETLLCKQSENQRLEEEMSKLSSEKQTLATKIVEAEEQLSELSKSLIQEREAQENKMKALKEAESNLTNEIAVLESKKKAQMSDFENLQKEFETLTSSIKSLSKQEKALEETVNKAELARVSATKRSVEEENAFLLMQQKTRGAAAQVEIYNQQISVLAEKKQTLEVDFETRRHQLEETLRKTEQEAIEARELKLKEQRLQSPSRKFQSPARKNGVFSTPSDLVTKDVLEAEARLALATKALEREQQKLERVKAEIDAEVKRGTEYEAAMVQTQIKWNETIQAARSQRDRYVSQAEEAKLKLNNTEKKTHVSKAQALIDRREARLATPNNKSQNTNDQQTEKK